MLQERKLSNATSVNRLLMDLPRKNRSRILEYCKPVDLVFGTVLCESDESIQYVYFPLTGFISLMVPIEDHPPLEVGLIGNEGMLGATLALGIDTAPLHAVVRGPGSALQMSIGEFQRELRDNSALLPTLNRYLYVLMAQLTQSSACTYFHRLEARLARCLLMTHDRSHADHFHFTHQFLADMLGVQRSAVTIAAGSMQKSKLIRYVRGDIRILDRRGIEALSCECYDAVVEDYDRMFA